LSPAGSSTDITDLCDGDPLHRAASWWTATTSRSASYEGTDLLNPRRRRVLLVDDHAERGQTDAEVEEAQVVEVLDPPHIDDVRRPPRSRLDPRALTATFRDQALSGRAGCGADRRRRGCCSPSSSPFGGLQLTDDDRRDHRAITTWRSFVVRPRSSVWRCFGPRRRGLLSPRRSWTTTSRAQDRTPAEGWASPQIETGRDRAPGRKDELMGPRTRPPSERLPLHLMVTDIIGRGTELLCARGAPPCCRPQAKDSDHEPCRRERKKSR